MMCLTESPLELSGDPALDFERFKTLDVDVGDTLFKVAQGLNSFTKEEKADF